MFLLGIGAATIISCQKEEVNVETTDSSHENRYSGEELFRGIFLMDGEVAEKIPSYSQEVEKIKRFEATQSIDRSEQDSLEAEFESQLIEEIDLLDPNYFDNLSDAIDSGNPYLINQEIVNGGTLFKNGLMNVYQNNNDMEAFNAINDLAQDIQGENFQTDEELIQYMEERFSSIESGDRAQCLVFVLGVVVYVGAVVDVAAAVNVSAAIDIYLEVALWGPALDNPISNGGTSEIQETMNHSLQREILVSDLAQLSSQN